MNYTITAEEFLSQGQELEKMNDQLTEVRKVILEATEELKRLKAENEELRITIKTYQKLLKQQ
jgi:regulator of replication initiation timing